MSNQIFFTKEFLFIKENGVYGDVIWIMLLRSANKLIMLWRICLERLWLEFEKKKTQLKRVIVLYNYNCTVQPIFKQYVSVPNKILKSIQILMKAFVSIFSPPKKSNRTNSNGTHKNVASIEKTKKRGK